MAEEKKNEAMSDEELDQIIQDMAKADEEAVPEMAPAPVLQMLPPAHAAKPKKVAASKPEYAERAAKSETPDQALTMELQGVVNLRLSFASGGRSIEIVCSEDALVCTMADGTEFRIPTGLAAAKKNIA